MAMHVHLPCTRACRCAVGTGSPRRACSKHHAMKQNASQRVPGRGPGARAGAGTARPHPHASASPANPPWRPGVPPAPPRAARPAPAHRVLCSAGSSMYRRRRRRNITSQLESAGVGPRGGVQGRARRDRGRPQLHPPAAGVGAPAFGRGGAASSSVPERNPQERRKKETKEKKKKKKKKKDGKDQGWARARHSACHS